MPRAGQNIRVMALQRRSKALSLFGMAALLVVFPFLLPVFWRRILLTPVNLPNWAYLACFVLAGLGVIQGLDFWRRANHPDQGAAGEEYIAEAKRQAVSMKELKKLKFVTPIVAFSKANVLVGREPVAGVYVLGVAELLPCLRSH